METSKLILVPCPKSWLSGTATVAGGARPDEGGGGGPEDHGGISVGAGGHIDSSLKTWRPQFIDRERRW